MTFEAMSRSGIQMRLRGGKARRWVGAVVFSLLLSGVTAQLDNDTSPTSVFRSRPDLHAPIIDFKLLRPELITPGYLFLAPTSNLDQGPYIYDNWGSLIWSGAGTSGPRTAHAPHVCQYHNVDHLCYFEGTPKQGFAQGHGVILDQNYRTVRTVEAAGAGASADMHEFRVTPYSEGRTALVTVYQPRRYDLTTNPKFNIERGMGWVVEGVFQEVDIDTGDLLFEWRSLDHVDPGESWTMPGTTDVSGDGLGEWSAWDYFHLNSIDKNTEGDYLITARHANAIYKVSGQNGSILWQMGGNSPTFQQSEFVFSFPHQALWVSENETHTVLSFFDNASNGFTNSNQHSHGRIVALDHTTDQASLIQEFGAPEPGGGLLSSNSGGVQTLPDGGGVHIGWGTHAYFSEYTTDGTPTMYGRLALRPSGVTIYRSGKYNWTGQPLTKPAIWSYSKFGTSKMTSYMSWNGATEIRSWNLFAADSPAGPWTLVQNVAKKSFETRIRLDEFHLWTYAQALDAQGRVLEDGEITRTFVPSEALRAACNDDGCDAAHRVSDKEYVDMDAEVEVDPTLLSTNRGFDPTHYYHENAKAQHLVVAPDAYYNNDHGTSSSSSSGNANHTSGSSIGSSIFILLLGVLSGVILALFGTFLYSHGAFASLDATIERLSGKFTRRDRRGGRSGSTTNNNHNKIGFFWTKSGSAALGKYSRVGEKEMEGLESEGSSASSSSSRGGGGGERGPGGEAIEMQERYVDEE